MRADREKTSDRITRMIASSAGPLTASQIGTRLGLKGSSLYNTLKELCDSGAIKLIPNSGFNGSHEYWKATDN